MKKILLLVVPCGLLIHSACVHEVQIKPAVPVDTTSSTGPPPTNGCSPDSVYFANDIIPLFTSNCSMPTCHGGAQELTLSNYTQIRRSRNDILDKIGNGEMPIAPVAPLKAAQIALINKWFNQGAKNSICAAACDTSKFAFTAIINPIVVKYCVSCHTGATAGNKNVDLSSYVGVKTVALDNGRLYKSVARLPGATPMPPYGPLAACEVTQIKKWVEAGALN